MKYTPTHYELKTDEGYTLKIAKCKADFDASLFQSGGTADGYITKRTKNNVFFFTHWKNKNYVVNKHKVILKVSKHEGKNWYQVAVLDFDYGSQNAFAQAVQSEASALKSAGVSL